MYLLGIYRLPDTDTFLKADMKNLRQFPCSRGKVARNRYAIVNSNVSSAKYVDRPAHDG